MVALWSEALGIQALGSDRELVALRQMQGLEPARGAGRGRDTHAASAQGPVLPTVHPALQ